MSCSFKEHKPALSLDSILAEANRCLNCYDAPCMRACPTTINVPGFIKKIATGNLRGSAKTILESNILGASCARVCPTEVLCEGACVLNDTHTKPIPIGQLQRHATDWAMANGVKPFEAGAKRPGRVAIVGAGPAGLACSAELIRLGYEAHIYEASERSGGLNATGVAAYKMSAAFAAEEVKWLIDAGLDIRCGMRVGVDITLAELEAQYDALFVGVGLGKVARLGLPGENLSGVVEAIGFIESLKIDPAHTKVGRRVVVIGGGNTSIDCVTQAVALGAEEVTLVYRRGVSEMPAYTHEVELAKAAGCRFAFHVTPQSIVGTSAVEGIVLQNMRPGPKDAAGHIQLETVPGETQTIACDMIIVATGQEPHRGFQSLLEKVGIKIERGRIGVDMTTMQTANPRYFAGGDCVSGGQEVVNAVAEGKRAATSIASFIDNKCSAVQGSDHG